MYQAAYAINIFDSTNSDGSALSTASFSELIQNALWGAQLNMGKQVIANHQALAMMRQCASHALNKPQHMVHVISSYTQQQIYYLIKTLLHFGISCGQIIVHRADDNIGCPEGLWLFVEDISTV